MYHQNSSPLKSASLRRVWNRSWFIQDQRIARYPTFLNIRTLYLICIFSVPSYLMDRPNHVIFHLIYLPVFHFTLSLLYSSLFNVTWCNIQQDTHIAVAISAVQCHKFNMQIIFLINFWFLTYENQCWVLLVYGIVKCNGLL